MKNVKYRGKVGGVKWKEGLTLIQIGIAFSKEHILFLLCTMEIKTVNRSFVIRSPSLSTCRENTGTINLQQTGRGLMP